MIDLPLNIKKQEPLLFRTSVRIGGPAEYFIDAYTEEEIAKAIAWARSEDIPVTLLGGGTNILISDNGIPGLVVRNHTSSITIVKERSPEDIVSQDPYRWESDKKKGTFRGIEFCDLDYDESLYPRVEVLVDSGVSLQKAINYLLDQGITGLQWYSGIPGTIGGAVFNNIHGGTHFLSEVIEKVEVIDVSGERKWIDIEELGMEYDSSRFHRSDEIITKTKFKLFKGDAERSKYIADEWKKRKKIQPRNSPGCAFRNISQEDRQIRGYPTTSTGYIVEHVLNMSGYRIGDAKVSEAHANFIVNEGDATAEDYLTIIKNIIRIAKEKAGIKLEPEIVLLGFDESEIEGVYN
jgi:UDP-N-acetylmuramate dehydrogenase